MTQEEQRANRAEKTRLSPKTLVHSVRGVKAARLAGAGALAGFGAAAVLVRWPRGWMLGQLLVGLAAVSLWGLADRALSEAERDGAPLASPVLIGLREYAGILALVAGGIVLIAVLNALFGGPWG